MSRRHAQQLLLSGLRSAGCQQAEAKRAVQPLTGAAQTLRLNSSRSALTSCHGAVPAVTV